MHCLAARSGVGLSIGGCNSSLCVAKCDLQDSRISVTDESVAGGLASAALPVKLINLVEHEKE